MDREEAGDPFDAPTSDVAPDKDDSPPAEAKPSAPSGWRPIRKAPALSARTAD
jgi:hypothetical protein